MGILANVTAAILAGAWDPSFRRFFPDQPKVLTEIGGRPFLSYILDHLQLFGLKEIVLCTGYRGEKIEEVFGSSYKSMRLWYSKEFSPRGTGGALRLALPFFRSAQILVLNGDSFCEANLESFWRSHMAWGADVSIVLTMAPEKSGYGVVITDEDGFVYKFSDKKLLGSYGWVNAGIYLIKRNLIRSIAPGRPVSLEREMFPSWRGQKIFGHRLASKFFEIKTPENYGQTDLIFAFSKSL
ncbi:MAG: sugar phosphate nucleotidyltransferase [Thermodesulfobacteriota bacterium]